MVLIGAKTLAPWLPYVRQWEEFIRTWPAVQKILDRGIDTSLLELAWNTYVAYAAFGEGLKDPKSPYTVEAFIEATKQYE